MLGVILGVLVIAGAAERGFSLYDGEGGPNATTNSKGIESGYLNHSILGNKIPGDYLKCPKTCFCEIDEKYSSCLGDGELNLPSFSFPIQRLELRNFYIRELDSSIMQFPDLLEFKIQQCNLSVLQDDAFVNLGKLVRLDLSQNYLKSLGPKSLQGLSSLRHLDLSSNLLSELTQPFQLLINLQHLNLKGNKLVKLNANIFEGLRKVQFINLDGNMIQSVNVAAFQHLGSMAHLILSNNPLYNLARLNFFGAKLQYIDISNIGITKVPQALTQFVRDLRLAKNSVKEIHRGDLDSYPYLGLLVLDDNGLDVLEEDALGRHEYLVSLWLNANKLKAIPQSLPISLKTLYIEENKITNLKSEDFLGLRNLEQLKLQRNQIHNISTLAFRDLVNLKTLDLQANNLSNISEAIFAALTTLQSLDLSQNHILTLTSLSFKGLANLRVLQLSRMNNDIKIQEIPFHSLSLQILEMYESPHLAKIILESPGLLTSLRGIKELNLMNNNLTALRMDFFSFLPNLSLIKLSGNSWNCSNRDFVLQMKAWMKNSSVAFYRSLSIRCETPESLADKPIILLEENDLNPGVPSNAPLLSPSIAAVTQLSLGGSSFQNKTRLFEKPFGIKRPLESDSYVDDEAEFLYPNEADSLYDVSKLGSKVNSNWTLEILTNITSTVESLPKGIDLNEPHWTISNRRPEVKLRNLHSIIKNGTMNSIKTQKMNLNISTKRLPLPENHQGEKKVKNYIEVVPSSLLERLEGRNSSQDSTTVTLGVVSAIMTIVLAVAGYIVARSICVRRRRISIFDKVGNSYWFGRASSEEDGEIMSVGDNVTCLLNDVEGSAIIESHNELSNRLYLLLQRDSSTGITPETLPDPTAIPFSKNHPLYVTNLNCHSSSRSRLVT